MLNVGCNWHSFDEERGPPRDGRTNSPRRRRVVKVGLLPATLLAIGVAVANPALGQSTLLPDALGAEYGYHDDVDVYSITGRWRIRDNVDWLASRNLEPRIDAQVSYWQSRVADTTYPNLWNVGVKGMLRWSPPAAGLRPFVEAGVGAQLQSNVHIHNRDLGIALQFASRAAIGVALREDHSMEIGAFVEHVSNARLAEPNDGLTFAGVMMRVSLR